jgi:adenine-specific DNA-methyltransferase
MNSLEGYKGWITKNYSGGENYTTPKGDGRYIYPYNAKKADAARDYIETLNLPKLDKDTLVCSIIFAINQVNNSVGQQQAYLKEWCDRSKKTIVFTLPPSIKGPTGTHIQGDCLNITYPKADIAYLDPPYTHTVAYHTYYHIWDSITLWDKPQTKGKAKRRIDRVKRGDNWREQYNNIFTNIPWYDIKNQDNIEVNGAYQSFKTMVEKLNTKHILISYSNQSIVSKDQMMDLLGKYGEVKVMSIDHKRNVMGSIGHSSKGSVISKDNPNVTEYLFLLTKK